MCPGKSVTRRVMCTTDDSTAVVQALCCLI